jgi:hypothetical protein
MTYFSSPQEVDTYVGGVLRLAAVHPRIGRRLAQPGVVLGIQCTDPDTHLTIALRQPVSVTWDDDAHPATDVELVCPADVLDGFFRGRASILDALATGTATARGRISKVLKVLPELELVFPVYRELVASKDRFREALADVPR